MSDPQDLPDEAPHEAGREGSGPDPVDELVERAREACADHPELLAALEDLQRLDEVELARRPEVLDAVHRTLREVLAGAGRPGPTP